MPILIAFNYDDYNLPEIDYRAKNLAKKLGTELEYISTRLYFFGARQSRDGVSDIFVSEPLFRKIGRTLQFIHNLGMKVRIGVDQDVDDNMDRAYWAAFSCRMRHEKVNDCAKIVLCMVYEMNSLLKDTITERRTG